MSATTRGVLMALLAFTIYSAHDAILKVLGDYSVFQIIFFAVLFSYMPFSLVLVLNKRKIAMSPRQPRWVLLRAVTTTAAGIFAFSAFTLLSMPEVYAMLFTAPMLIALLAVFFLGEKIYLFRWFAIALGLCGVLVVLRPGVSTVNLGHAAGIAAALCIAISSVISRKVAARESVASMTVIPMLMALAVNGVALLWVYQPPELSHLLLMFLLGAMALAAQVLLLAGYRLAPAQYVAPCQYVQMLWAILIGAVFFNEPPDQMVIIGCMIIVLSGMLIVWRETTQSTRQPFLSTRNLRAVAGPLMQSQENDKEEPKED